MNDDHFTSHPSLLHQLLGLDLDTEITVASNNNEATDDSWGDSRRFLLDYSSNSLCYNSAPIQELIVEFDNAKLLAHPLSQSHSALAKQQQRLEKQRYHKDKQSGLLHRKKKHTKKEDRWNSMPFLKDYKVPENKAAAVAVNGDAATGKILWPAPLTFAAAARGHSDSSLDRKTTLREQSSFSSLPSPSFQRNKKPLLSTFLNTGGHHNGGQRLDELDELMHHPYLQRCLGEQLIQNDTHSCAADQDSVDLTEIAVTDQRKLATSGLSLNDSFSDFEESELRKASDPCKLPSRKSSAEIYTTPMKLPERRQSDESHYHDSLIDSDDDNDDDNDGAINNFMRAQYFDKQHLINDDVSPLPMKCPVRRSSIQSAFDTGALTCLGDRVDPKNQSMFNLHEDDNTVLYRPTARSNGNTLLKQPVLPPTNPWLAPSSLVSTASG